MLGVLDNSSALVDNFLNWCIGFTRVLPLSFACILIFAYDIKILKVALFLLQSICLHHCLCKIFFKPHLDVLDLKSALCQLSCEGCDTVYQQLKDILEFSSRTFHSILAKYLHNLIDGGEVISYCILQSLNDSIFVAGLERKIKVIYFNVHAWQGKHIMCIITNFQGCQLVLQDLCGTPSLWQKEFVPSTSKLIEDC
ncbi:hypothetical protein ROZALSC1DRAFT_25584 [Rozella allomycis CSF55]|uniref:Uncharacterized protein n=1 Tax=Rozella allomycis (strain CSF55) TaxID=988480 RepID=A0A4P9YBF0_ROZAC|nr:hypothetical protein ROZALSC1DRAFT_25584 [Rozella allomycis CSF55]